MLSSKLVDMPVLSLRLGAKIAHAHEAIINPHSFKIMGWWCSSSSSTNNLVLLTEDVREVSSRGLVVDDVDSLTEPEDLTRHKEILEVDFRIIGKPVRTKTRKLGKVSDYSYNEGMFVQKLYVARPLIHLLSSDATLVIDRTQIIEVTDHYIMVKDTEILEPAQDFAPEPIAG